MPKNKKPSEEGYSNKTELDDYTVIKQGWNSTAPVQLYF